MHKQNLKVLPYLKIIGAVIAILYVVNCIRTPDEFHFLGGVNLIIHEAGHFVFMFFGQFIHVLGGSLLQVMMPICFAVYFYLRKDMYSGSIILLWLGQSITDVARYLSDAAVMQLPLLGGDSVIHDWNFLLTAVGLLNYTSIIGSVLNALGILVVLSLIHI